MYPHHRGARHDHPPDNVPTGAPCWIDLMSSDTDKSRPSTASCSGGPPTSPTRSSAATPTSGKDGEPVAGLMTAQEEGMPDVWSVYLAVDDAEKTVGGGQGQRRPGLRGADGGGRPRHHGGPGRRGRRHDRHVAARASTGAASGRHRRRAVPLRAVHPRLRQRPCSSTRTCSGGSPQTVGDEPEFRYTVLEVADGEQAGIMDASDWLPGGRARPLVGVLRGRRRRRHAGQGRASSVARRSSPGEDTPVRPCSPPRPTATGAVFKLRAEHRLTAPGHPSTA